MFQTCKIFEKLIYWPMYDDGTVTTEMLLVVKSFLKVSQFQY